MPRPPSTEPTDRELEILHVLWEHGAVTLSQVCAALESRGKSPTKRVPATTIATMLKVMLEKDLVERIPGARGYQWSAKISQRAARSTMVQRLMDRVFEGSAQRLVAHVLEAGKLSKQQVEQLQGLLDQHAPAKSKRNPKQKRR